MRELTVEDLCRDQRERLVGVIAAYCGDGDAAEDIVQDALVRAAENWDDLRDMDAPNMWLHRVAMNLATSHFRRRRAERRVLERLGSPSVWSSDSDPAVRLALVRAVETLPARQRAAVALRYLLDWSAADVAEVLGTTEGNVRVLAHRGVTRLREHFESASGPGGAGSHRASVVGVVVLVVAVAAAIALRDQGPTSVHIDPVGTTEDGGGAADGEALGIPHRCPRGAGEQVASVRDGGGLFTLHVAGDRFHTCAVASVFGEHDTWSLWQERSGVLGPFDRGYDTVIVDGGATIPSGAGDASGEVLTYLHGRVGRDADRVVIIRDDGTEDDALIVGTVIGEGGEFVAAGHFVAAWASSASPVRLRVLAEDGEVLADRAIEGGWPDRSGSHDDPSLPTFEWPDG